MSGAVNPAPDGGAIVRNEFAAVEVRVDRRATGDRLIIEDLRGRTWIALDALELERITTLRQAELSWVVSPERSWRETPERDDEQGAP